MVYGKDEAIVAPQRNTEQKGLSGPSLREGRRRNAVTDHVIRDLKHPVTDRNDCLLVPAVAFDPIIAGLQSGVLFSRGSERGSGLRSDTDCVCVFCQFVVCRRSRSVRDTMAAQLHR